MPVATSRISITLGKEETAMLRQLVRATGKTQPEIVRALIVGAYGKLVPKLKAKAGFGFDAVLAPVAKKNTLRDTRRGKSPPRKR